MIEALPRVAPFITLLKARPDIPIHVLSKSHDIQEKLRLLGLKNTLITNTIRASTILLPGATPCGVALAPNVQLLSRLYRNNLPFANRKTLVYVERMVKRVLDKTHEVERILRKIAKRDGLKFVLFSDRQHLPGTNETANIFKSAKIIFGPHGAGLDTKIIF